MDVLIVDDEIGDRVTKTFSVVGASSDGDSGTNDAGDAGDAGSDGSDGSDGSGGSTDRVLAVNGRDEVGNHNGDGLQEQNGVSGGDGGRGTVEGGGAACDNVDEENDRLRKDRTTSILRVDIQATEAKMLRVSISSFYDMLNVFLKCQQEFG